MKYIYLSGNGYDTWQIEEVYRSHRIIIKEFLSKNKTKSIKNYEYGIVMKNKAIQFIENLKKDNPSDRFIY